MKPAKKMSDFEKLLIANAYIKQLKQELESERAYGKALQESLEAKDKELRQMLNWQKGDLKEIKKDRYVQNLINNEKSLKNTVKQLKQDNERLIIEVNQHRDAQAKRIMSNY